MISGNSNSAFVGMTQNRRLSNDHLKGIVVMKNKTALIKLLLILMISAIVTVFLYILLHEFGHMIVMLSAGDRITEFSIFGAHVSGEGGNYTNTSDLWMYANGTIFPLLLSYIFLLFYQKESMNMVYRIVSLFFGFSPAFALILWFVKPFVYVRGTFTAGDDTTQFLYNFSQGHSPILVSIAAALLFGISIFLVIRKRVLRNFIEEIKRTREAVKRER